MIKLLDLYIKCFLSLTVMLVSSFFSIDSVTYQLSARLCPWLGWLHAGHCSSTSRFVRVPDSTSSRQPTDQDRKRWHCTFPLKILRLEAIRTELNHFALFSRACSTLPSDDVGTRIKKERWLKLTPASRAEQLIQKAGSEDVSCCRMR